MNRVNEINLLGLSWGSGMSMIAKQIDNQI